MFLSVFAGLALLADASLAQAQLVPMKVTLLGTGSPAADDRRFGPSTLVEAGNLKLLFDAGRGATIRLNQLGIPLARVDVVFFTHYHSDHTVGFPDLWLTGWIGVGGQRKQALQIVGPAGANSFARGLEAAYSADTTMRASENFPKSGAELRVDEFESDGVVFEREGVKVMAFTVKHGAVKPAVGYRIEHGGKSVVISGDTNYEPNVISNAKGVDLLIHEVMVVRPEIADRPLVKYVMGSHTSPREAGDVFSKAKPRMAAFTHIIQFGSPAATLEELEKQTRETYSGPLEIGADLLQFEIGEDIKVTRRSP